MIRQTISMNAAVPSGADPPAQSYSAYAGNAVLLEFLIVDSNGQPLSLTGCTIRYHVRQSVGGAELTGYPKTAGNSSDPDGQGKCTVVLAATDTASLNGGFTHSLVVTDGSTPASVTTVMTGTATFKTGGV